MGWFSKKAKTDEKTGNKKFSGFVVGTPLIKNSDGSAERISKIIEDQTGHKDNGYLLKSLGQAVTKSYIFKHYRLG